MKAPLRTFPSSGLDWTYLELNASGMAETEERGHHLGVGFKEDCCKTRKMTEPRNRAAAEQLFGPDQRSTRVSIYPFLASAPRALRLTENSMEDSVHRNTHCLEDKTNALGSSDVARTVVTVEPTPVAGPLRLPDA